MLFRVIGIVVVTLLSIAGLVGIGFIMRVGLQAIIDVGDQVVGKISDEEVEP